MANLYLFRHGQTEYNRDLKFTGHSDSKITDLGNVQNQHLNKLLKNIHIHVAFHSSQGRSKLTLETAISGHTECSDIREDKRIMERNYGVLNDTFHADYSKLKGQAEFDRIHRGWADKAEGGESYADLCLRIQSFIDDLYKEFSGKDINIAISAHGNSVRIFRHLIEGAPIEVTTSWILTYASIWSYKI